MPISAHQNELNYILRGLGEQADHSCAIKDAIKNLELGDGDAKIEPETLEAVLPDCDRIAGVVFLNLQRRRKGLLLGRHRHRVYIAKVVLDTTAAS